MYLEWHAFNQPAINAKCNRICAMFEVIGTSRVGEKRALSPSSILPLTELPSRM